MFKNIGEYFRKFFACSYAFMYIQPSARQQILPTAGATICLSV